MIIYLLIVGDTRGEQCSLLIGPVHPILGLSLATSDPAVRSPTLAAGHRKICGDLDALLPTSSCQGSLSILGNLASHWSATHYSWPLIGWWLVMHVSRPSWGPGWHPSPHYSAHVRQMTQNNPSSGQEKGSVPCTVHAVTSVPSVCFTNIPHLKRKGGRKKSLAFL